MANFWSKSHEDEVNHDIGHKGLRCHALISCMEGKFGAINAGYCYALEVSMEGDDDDNDDGSYDYAPAA